MVTNSDARAAVAGSDSAGVALSALEIVAALRSGLAGLLGALRATGSASAPVDAAEAAGADLGSVLALVPTGDLRGLFADLMAVRALAEGATVAVVAESERRGVIADGDGSLRPVGPKITRWVKQVTDEAGVPVTGGVARTYRTLWELTSRPEMAPLAAAVTAGKVSLQVGARLGDDLDLLSAAIPDDVWGIAATHLIEYAAGGASTGELASVREALIATYGAEGEFEDQQERLHAVRCFSTPTKNKAGLWVGTYAMDNDAHAILTGALDALAAPFPSAEGVIDARSVGQRNMDAIVEMARVVATDPSLLGHVRPVSAAKAQVVVTIEESRLRADLAGRGYATDGHGHPLTPATARRLACEARIIPAVLGGDSAVLDLGRSTRLASPDQVRYLGLRDKGCTFPGCDRPPSWCEAHHLDEWTQDLGPTDVDNLALLCTHHHTVVHTQRMKGDLIDGTIRWRRREVDDASRRKSGPPPRRATTMSPRPTLGGRTAPASGPPRPSSRTRQQVFQQ